MAQVGLEIITLLCQPQENRDLQVCMTEVVSSSFFN